MKTKIRVIFSWKCMCKDFYLLSTFVYSRYVTKIRVINLLYCPR